MSRATRQAAFREKLLIVNIGIFVGLAIELWRGAAVAPVLLTGLVFVLLFNAVVYFSSKSKRRP